MYRYRRLTDTQKQTVVAERKRRGLPLHRPPHFPPDSGWYLITAANYEHRHHFKAPKELTALVRNIKEAMEEEAEYEVAAWVVLSNHYHLVVKVDDLKCLGKKLGPVHGRSSHYANKRDNTPGRRVWYRFSDREIRSERHFQTALHYLFMNPVKHGYVDDPIDWEWSSVHEFIHEHGMERFEQIRRDFPLREFGRGWDD